MIALGWGQHPKPSSQFHHFYHFFLFTGRLCKSGTDRRQWLTDPSQEAACGQGYALQTLAHTHCAELSPDEGLPLGAFFILFRDPTLGFPLDGTPDRWMIWIDDDR